MNRTKIEAIVVWSATVLCLACTIVLLAVVTANAQDNPKEQDDALIAAEEDPAVSQRIQVIEMLLQAGLIDGDAYDWLMYWARNDKQGRISNYLRPTAQLLASYTPYNQTGYDEVSAYPGSPEQRRNFELRKAAFGLQGRVWFDQLSFKLTAATYEQDNGRLGLELENAYARLAYTPYALQGSQVFRPQVGLALGAMKIPFSRENITDSGMRQFIDEALVVDQMDIQRDIGAALDVRFSFGIPGRPPQGEDKLGRAPWLNIATLHLSGGAFNGRGNKVFAHDNNDDLLYVGRARLDLLGSMEPGEGDARMTFLSLYSATKQLSLRSGPRLSLGGSYLVNNDIDRTVTAWGADAELRWFGLSVLGELIHTEFEPDLAENSSTAVLADKWETEGWFVQAGFFAWPRHIELVGRYQEYKLDTPDEIEPERLVTATSYGVNVHFASAQRVKLMADYTQRAEIEGLPQLDNDTCTVQLSLTF